MTEDLYVRAVNLLERSLSVFESLRDQVEIPLDPQIAEIEVQHAALVGTLKQVSPEERERLKPIYREQLDQAAATVETTESTSVNLIDYFEGGQVLVVLWNETSALLEEIRRERLVAR